MDSEQREALANVWSAIERLRSRIERLTLLVGVGAVLLLGERAFKLFAL